MGNKVTLEFAGDASDLAKAAKQATSATDDVGAAAKSSSDDLGKAAKESTDFSGKIGHLGSAVSGASDAIDNIGGSLQAVIDLQQAGAERASRLARAMNDVEQAQEDLQQALRDGAQAQLDSDQAAIDLRQANLDAAAAIKDYNDAVKEHGKNSLEAQQAQIDLAQAQQDVKQANEDAAQATRDASQATIDAKGAQLDLNDAQREAHPPEMQKWADDLNMISPLITALVGVVGLATGAQWLFNAALWASPITWIVLAIAALVAIIVVVATKTTWFQDAWSATWSLLKSIGSWFAGPFTDAIVGAFHWVTGAMSDWWARIKAVPQQIKSAFSAVTDFIFAPFRAAFNLVASAWNGTVGRLSWTVPGWVPGIGGNSLSAPKLPHFHQGGIVPGGLGAEVVAVLQAGERVTSSSGVSGGHAEANVVELRAGDGFGRLVLDAIRDEIGLRGGDPVRVLASGHG